MPLLPDRGHREHAVVDRVGLPAPDIRRIVVVEDVIGARLAVRLDVDRVEIKDDRRNAGLRRVGAIGVAAAPIAVVDVPVVRSREGIDHLDLIEILRRVGAGHEHVVGRGRIAVGVGVIERVGVAEHHGIGHRAAHHRLMIIVGERIFAGELGEVGRVALGDIVEAHRDIAFMQGVRGRAVAAGGDRLLDPREEVGLASARVGGGPVRGVAIHLLPHLIEAMDRAAAVGVVAGLRRQRIGAVRQIVVVRDARIRRIHRNAGRAGQQKSEIRLIEAIFGLLGEREVREGAGAVERRVVDAGVRRRRRVGRARRLQHVGGLIVRLLGPGVIRIEIGVHRRVLRCEIVVHAGSAVDGDDLLGEQIVDRFAAAGLVGREQMVEAAILADDHDDMLDGTIGPALAVPIAAPMNGLCERRVGADEREDGRRDDGAVTQSFRKVRMMHGNAPVGGVVEARTPGRNLGRLHVADYSDLRQIHLSPDAAFASD